MVIASDGLGSCKSNYRTITTTMAPVKDYMEILITPSSVVYSAHFLLTREPFEENRVGYFYNIDAIYLHCR